MESTDRFAEKLIDVAERFADVNDAAKGRGIRRGRPRMRWLILPAAGAGLYALGAQGSFTRQAKTVLNQAKERATDLPDDLIGRVQQATGQTGQASGGSGNGRRPASRPRKSTGSSGTSRRKTGTARSSSR